MKRRQFLKVVGSTTVIVAATSYGAFLSSRTPIKALLPWKTAGNLYTDPMRRALSYAILAPNPHNRQPWLLDFKSDMEVLLYCDLTRLLAETDPFSRQIMIGLGAFLELFSQAATQTGHRAELSLFPEGVSGDKLDNRPIARLILNKDVLINEDPLFQFVLNRHTNRNAYDLSKLISNETLIKITKVKEVEETGLSITAIGLKNIISSDSTHLSNEKPSLEILRQLTKNALKDELLDPVAFQESIDLMRIGRSEIEASPDGISLGGGFLESLKLLGLLSKKELADPKSQSFQVGLDMADEQTSTAMGFVWINTLDNSRLDQLAAGRSYMKLSLKVAEQGLQMQPMSQALQEYSTMESHYQQIHKLLTIKPHERVQMLARLGYAEQSQPSPRWPLSTRIRGY
ncbi:MAG: twin-arginine translocation pathway signal protein [Gammaproteobacteria bacterium]|nr:MAG: twin-arginine translocation pathway signal protein [Gammaproteobacteria bacterium]